MDAFRELLCSVQPCILDGSTLVVLHGLGCVREAGTLVHDRFELDEETEDVSDLLAKLEASVKARRSGGDGSGSDEPAKKAPAKKTAAKKAPAKKAAAKKSPAKKAAAKK